MNLLSRLACWIMAIALMLITPAASLAQSASDSLVQLAELRALAINQASQQASTAVVQLRLIGEYQALSRDAFGTTTGVLLDTRWVVTSSYGMKNRPESVIVTYSTGERGSAALTAIDHSRQVALLRLNDPAPFAPAKLEPRTNPRPGETAIALGAGYSASEGGVAVGIVSATGRLRGRAVQTDAAISPANYGGPLLDLRGRVLGIVTPIGQNGGQSVEWYDSGIGFAVPVPDIVARLPRMKQGKDIHPGVAGIRLRKGNAFTTAPTIEKILPESPAEEAELKKGDVIVAVNGKTVEYAKQFQIALGSSDAGEEVSLDVMRDEKSRTVRLTLAAAADLKGSEDQEPSLLNRIKEHLPKPE